MKGCKGLLTIMVAVAIVGVMAGCEPQSEMQEENLEFVQNVEDSVACGTQPDGYAGWCADFGAKGAGRAALTVWDSRGGRYIVLDQRDTETLISIGDGVGGWARLPAVVSVGDVISYGGATFANSEFGLMTLAQAIEADLYVHDIGREAIGRMKEAIDDSLNSPAAEEASMNSLSAQLGGGGDSSAVTTTNTPTIVYNIFNVVNGSGNVWINTDPSAAANPEVAGGAGPGGSGASPSFAFEWAAKAAGP